MVEVYKYTKLGMKMGVEIDLLKSSSSLFFATTFRVRGRDQFPIPTSFELWFESW